MWEEESVGSNKLSLISATISVFLIDSMVIAAANFGRIEFFSLIFIVTVEWLWYMLRITDDNTQMRYDDLWYSKHPGRSVSSTLLYIIGNDHVAKIIRFKNCTMNIGKKGHQICDDWAYYDPRIWCILIFKCRVVSHFDRFYHICFRYHFIWKNETTKLDEYLNIIF